MLGYLSLDIICSSKLTVFLELRSRKTVRLSEQIMSADKYPSIFSRQMKAIVYAAHHLCKPKHYLIPHLLLSNNQLQCRQIKHTFKIKHQEHCIPKKILWNAPRHLLLPQNCHESRSLNEIVQWRFPYFVLIESKSTGNYVQSSRTVQSNSFFSFETLVRQNLRLCRATYPHRSIQEDKYWLLYMRVQWLLAI